MPRKSPIDGLSPERFAELRAGYAIRVDRWSYIPELYGEPLPLGNGQFPDSRAKAERRVIAHIRERTLLERARA